MGPHPVERLGGLAGCGKLWPAAPWFWPCDGEVADVVLWRAAAEASLTWPAADSAIDVARGVVVETAEEQLTRTSAPSR